MKEEHGFDLPRRLQIEFSKTIQHVTEDTGTEITPGVMWDTFQREYIPDEPRFRLRTHELHTNDDQGKGRTMVVAHLGSTARESPSAARATVRSRPSSPRCASSGKKTSTCSTMRSTRSVAAPTPRPSPTWKRFETTVTSAGDSAPTRTSRRHRCGPCCRRSSANTGESRDAPRRHRLRSRHVHVSTAGVLALFDRRGGLCRLHGVATSVGRRRGGRFTTVATAARHEGTTRAGSAARGRGRFIKPTRELGCQVLGIGSRTSIATEMNALPIVKSRNHHFDNTING